VRPAYGYVTDLTCVRPSLLRRHGRT